MSVDGRKAGRYWMELLTVVACVGSVGSVGFVTGDSVLHLVEESRHVGNVDESISDVL